MLAVRRTRRGAARRAVPARWRVLGFLVATYLAGPMHFGSTDNVGGVLRRSSWWSSVVFALACRCHRAAPYRYLPLVRRARGDRRAPRRRSPRRRAPRAQHRLRVLGDGRDPGVGPGQHHVRAAHRGGAAPRPGCSCGDGPAARTVYAVIAMLGVHAAGDGGAVVRRRLRRRDRGRPGLRAASPGCCSAAGSASGPS